MVHMVGVSDFEKTGANPNNGNSVFYVLLECGHGQTVEMHMPKPPSRVMCKECMDIETIRQGIVSHTPKAQAEWLIAFVENTRQS